MGDVIKLPSAKLKGKISVEEALHARRSTREYSATALKLEDVAQLLWAAQGITAAKGLRTAPSPIAVYLVQAYLVAGNVDGLKPGVYSYKPQDHSLELVKSGALESQLAGLGQQVFGAAPTLVVIASVDDKASKTFGDFAVRASSLEIGHVAENVALQATAMGLGLVTASGFDNGKAREILGLPASETPVYLIPVGRIV
ncbi:MAG: SagB/ThcOx family dehydrogenase [Dehalococcoidia bacterium]